jgi:hypothetical protein
MDGWMDGGMDGWLDGDGWKEVATSPSSAWARLRGYQTRCFGLDVAESLFGDKVNAAE